MVQDLLDEAQPSSSSDPTPIEMEMTFDNHADEFNLEDNINYRSKNKKNQNY